MSSVHLRYDVILKNISHLPHVIYMVKKGKFKKHACCEVEKQLNIVLYVNKCKLYK